MKGECDEDESIDALMGDKGKMKGELTACFLPLRRSLRTNSELILSLSLSSLTFKMSPLVFLVLFLFFKSMLHLHSAAFNTLNEHRDTDEFNKTVCHISYGFILITLRVIYNLQLFHIS